MTELYPLRFKPIFKDYLWGGTKLRSVLNKDFETDTAAESWEVSAVEGNVSVVMNGPLAGKELQELIDTYQSELLGEAVFNRFGNMFPILIKFIDANKDLSVQLHPNDSLARERHDSFGKTEMWVVMEADEGSELIVGFNKDLSREEYTEALESGKLMDILNREKVGSGDTYFIKAGKVHAIGAGILLAEIQQTSNITYRIYDYDRKDKDGNTRELHTELSVEAIDYKKKDDYKVRYEEEYNVSNPMVKCDYFNTNFLNIYGTHTAQLVNRDSFTIYMCIEGQVQLTVNGNSESLTIGETILIPANINTVNFSAANAKILEVHL
ncbi:type I phosphomannose isomerase catalytic subunit [Robertkochia solimangrovi]|uniref:type I phosphomannose isomerase catalytic subunit n=1 Tax=Robertkochia solimangrovi TaxID=2213046 RepID=UPI00117D15EA|nr:type I phosphomannose isomerase catalytic subunit [Robertkochia solimangrovi]TRZ41776.1 mannose-6-phosphate isomerase [Robertkochia solimangrovi]